ncbi:MAG: gamma-glutamyltransferase [Gammaproteobacteria bacterium]|nr:gamma-glutamyltransferase [Gammaproteobacteria bacterium]
MRALLLRLLLGWPLLTTVGCGADVNEDVAANDPAPESPGHHAEGVITAANPYAVEAGMAILRQGGSAVDAAIAAHAVLGLVEPQSSGLGGGGFMLAYRARDGVLAAIDGRETAPASARPDMFLDEDGAELGFIARVESGHAIGVPGTVALYASAHERFGTLPWADLFVPAIELADEGFEVSPRLHDLLVRISRFTRLDENPVTAEYFFPGGEPLAVGTLRRNPDYANTLRRVAEHGSAGFYQGPIAQSISEVAAEEPRPSIISQADFDGYEAVVREAVCGPYRGYRVCSMPPPSSGSAVVAMLGLLERLTPDGMTDTVEGWSAFIDAMKLGYADRDHYVADADFVPVPVADLIDPGYLDVRASARPPAAVDAAPGDPGAVLRDDPIIGRWARAGSGDDSGTTHLSVIDAEGNAVAFTASVEFAFGGQRMASGFILNNELTDFAATPSIDGVPVANAVAPGKRPRSSMTPVLVFDADDELFMVTGSPGGNSIIAYTLKSLVGVIDLGLDAQGAVDLPNIIARGLPVQIEHERAEPALVTGLRDLGYPIDERGGENSGLHTLVVHPDHIDGAADPRREGRVGRVARDAPASP